MWMKKNMGEKYENVNSVSEISCGGNDERERKKTTELLKTFLTGTPYVVETMSTAAVAPVWCYWCRSPYITHYISEVNADKGSETSCMNMKMLDKSKMHLLIRPMGVFIGSFRGRRKSRQSSGRPGGTVNRDYTYWHTLFAHKFITKKKKRKGKEKVKEKRQRKRLFKSSGFARPIMFLNRKNTISPFFSCSF